MGNSWSFFPSYLVGAVKQTVATLHSRIPFDPGTQRPLVLIPGAMCTGSVMNRLGQKLRDRGLDVCVPPTFPYYLSAVANTCRLRQASGMLLDFLDELYESRSIREVDVVGHSNGGLIALLAQELLDSGEVGCRVKLNRLITLASPHGGFPGGRALSVMLPCCRDVIPGCHTLARTARAKRLLVACLVAGSDFLIPPENQSLPGCRKIVMDGFQHMDFIVGSNRRVEQSASEIERILRSRPEDSPEECPLPREP